MASPIPNLNTFRRGGPRLRGGRRGGQATSVGEDESASGDGEASARDKIIQQTDNDASSSRLSAVQLGYLSDDYAREFLQSGEQITRRYPIINRGTYVRTTAIDRLVGRFLRKDPGQRKQIISLGAGSDTRFWNLDSDHSNVTYHELDFEANVAAKREVIKRSARMLEELATLKAVGDFYHLHALDLRDLVVDNPPSIPDLDVALPTLILSECCLCYLPPDAATSVLKYFQSRLQGAVGIVVYEPIRPYDAFGKTMVSNLASRGIHMQTLKRYHSLEAQRQRLKLAGFTEGQGARDVYQIWESDDWVKPAERERVEKLEWLDEIEEWKLLASHYCVAWGWKGDTFEAAWREIEGGRTSAEARDDDVG